MRLSLLPVLLMLACGKFGLSDNAKDTADTPSSSDRGAINPLDTSPLLDTDTDIETTETTEPTDDTDSTPSGPDTTDTTDEPTSDEVDCERGGAPHIGDTCVTATIACGETVDFTTQGGTESLDATFYESATCFIPYSDYAGPERVYELILDGDGGPMTATVTLDSPCEDLSLATFFWTDDECPEGSAHNISSCGGSSASDGDEEVLYTTGEDPDRYLIAIDGDTPAAFRLTVTCES